MDRSTARQIGTARQVDTALEVLLRLSEVCDDGAVRDMIGRVRHELHDAQDAR